MDLRHHFRQLKLIAESSDIAFRLRKAVPFLNSGQSHPAYHLLQGSNHNT